MIPECWREMVDGSQKRLLTWVAIKVSLEITFTLIKMETLREIIQPLRSNHTTKMEQRILSVMVRKVMFDTENGARIKARSCSRVGSEGEPPKQTGDSGELVTADHKVTIGHR